jgi:hypothetical protein
MEPDDAGLGPLVDKFDKVYKAFLESESGTSATVKGKALVQAAQQTQDQLSDEDRLEADFPLRDFAIATERSEVLLKHLQEHKLHYSFALFQSLPPQEQLDYIERAMAGIDSGFDPGYFQPRVVSQIGEFLLVPLNQSVIPDADALLTVLKGRITIRSETDPAILPSPGMSIESRLGQCSGCEGFITDSRTLDLELRAQQVRQARAESDRLDARLKANPPVLDDPRPQVPRLEIDLQQPVKPS